MNENEVPYHLGPLTQQQAQALPEDLKLERKRHKAREKSRKWAQANPDKARDAERRWRENNIEHHRTMNRERSRRWVAANPDKAREKHHRQDEARIAKAREEAQAWYAAAMEETKAKAAVRAQRSEERKAENDRLAFVTSVKANFAEAMRNGVFI